MAENKIPIRTALMPAYYKDFHCIMGACQDNCCDDGWRIEFNKKDYLTVKRAPKSAELEAEMKEGMRRLREREHDNMYAEFQVTEEGRCAFHTPEGLCRLQMECGAETLPKVCRVYPRKWFYTTYALEYSLSPSCEGVLALLWDLPEGVDFIEESLPAQQWRDSTAHNEVAFRFQDVRSLFIDVLQERALSMPQRLLMLGLMAQRLQGLDWNDKGSVERWLIQSEQMLHDPAVAGQLAQMPRDRKLFISNGLRTLAMSMRSENRGVVDELLTAVFPGWQKHKVGSLLINDHLYGTLEAKLEELLRQSESFFENLMVSTAFYLGFPGVNQPEQLWKSYVNLCNIYSIYRFTAVCAMAQEASKARLFHVLVQISRIMLHNGARQTALRDEFFQNDSATLAHMAILVGG